MKSMTCKELGGACDRIFRADTFEALAEQSKKHGMEMFQQQDPEHLDAMKRMQALMQQPKAMEAWFNQKKAVFDQLPHDQ